MSKGTPLFLTVILPAWLASSGAAGAQQYITDDAAITEYKACQLQLWHGERSSWLLPVCTLFRGAELSAGLIVMRESRKHYHTEYVAQVKTLLRPLSSKSYGIGIVAGTGRDPGLHRKRVASHSLYAYVPASVSLMRDRLVLHENTGWLYDTRDGEGQHSLTWAARADVALTRRIAAIGESFGSNRGEAEFQAGVRAALRPNRVQLDASYGGSWSGDGSGAGWTLGLTLMSKRIF